ncbi:MAG: enoyl-CoA hydratase-related protein [Dehalococcoidia bacterium]
MEELVLWEKVGRLGYLTLNRPEKLNALNAPLLAALEERLEQAKQDDEVRVLIIRGAGRAFSAGFDLSPDAPERQGHRDIVDDRDRLQRNTDLWLKIWDHPKPVIAQVHGYCLAGATQLCIFCDLTVVAEDARIGFPAIPVGGGYISPMWAWLVGPKRAKEMSFIPGSQISGSLASEWGWANRATPADQLEQTVRGLAEQIATVPSKILHMKKVAVNRTMDTQGFRVAVGFGSEFDALLHHSGPVQELSATIRELGLKGAIEAFRAGR